MGGSNRIALWETCWLKAAVETGRAGFEPAISLVKGLDLAALQVVENS